MFSIDIAAFHSFVNGGAQLSRSPALPETSSPVSVQMREIGNPPQPQLTRRTICESKALRTSVPHVRDKFVSTWRKNPSTILSRYQLIINSSALATARTLSRQGSTKDQQTKFERTRTPTSKLQSRKSLPHSKHRSQAGARIHHAMQSTVPSASSRKSVCQTCSNFAPSSQAKFKHRFGIWSFDNGFDSELIRLAEGLNTGKGSSAGGNSERGDLLMFRCGIEADAGVRYQSFRVADRSDAGGTQEGMSMGSKCSLGG
jgi:hypothetical protein